MLGIETESGRVVCAAAIIARHVLDSRATRDARGAGGLASSARRSARARSERRQRRGPAGLIPGSMRARYPPDGQLHVDRIQSVIDCEPPRANVSTARTGWPGGLPRRVREVEDPPAPRSPRRAEVSDPDVLLL